MFDRKSDYALNKMYTDAIVCKSVTGVHTRITREDFDSEAEFLKWKAWSDEDYHDTEAGGREDDDCLRLSEQHDVSTPSVEEAMLSEMQDAEKRREIEAKLNRLETDLTSAQHRRLLMHLVEHMTTREIAEKEGR